MEQEINNSEVFLKSVLQNSVGFSVPKDYFKNQNLFLKNYYTINFFF